ncbi:MULTISPECIES: TetR/AcrR family transcriptional regulator [Streptomyces]|uniref:TetR/AcrR family transcriptional regulator n=1 Tax=Streptomyces TaxID=1883 RepID=UPI00163CC4AA|nr:MULTISPECIES: TetR/AcrR family transcriptional regulator C-terminal domain-containing protein [Streptomyces]MBC2875015.1 TetR/AcrR family transcriptional regulator C-terminal domain-containing protein [Streptomyces sp. TYQ1024]UBI37449.1 TetR/AcrR family transcriptional regulator [Streptomyces mobaraensis]UKW30040.1 TetR/AcrR family transcriptional regulator [Streptomyces sp. TYQ1024]
MADANGADGAPGLWERLERPAPAPRPAALTPQRIATAAVAIADAEGLEAVTMRRLAADLGVAPMAAYRYVSGKDELIALMVDFVHGEMELPDATDDWRTVLRAVAVRTRALALEHPWMARADHLSLTPNQFAVSERVLAALGGLGLDADTMMAVYRTASAYVRGAVDSEISLTLMMRKRGWNTGDETREGLAPEMTWLMKTGRYPATHRYLAEAQRKDDAEWRFELGLDCVLDGIAARLGI